MDSKDFRRHLHRFPELSFEEHATAAFIEQVLDEEGISHRRIAKTGVLAKIEGVRASQRTVVLRADIDALPVNEANDIDYVSENQGVMHACGHDMHAAMLYGALLELNKNRDFEGTIFGLFQPGEECNPGGASLVLAEEPFEGYDVVAVVGQHVEAYLPVGTVGFREGKYMASSDELRFTLRGVGGHGALRSTLKDPVAAMAEFVSMLLSVNRPDLVLSIGRVEALGATNVIPHEVKLEGTLRTFNEEERTQTKEWINCQAKEIGEKHGVNIIVDINKGYPSVVNNEELTAMGREVAKEIVGCSVVDLSLRTTAEDFGFYGLRYPSLFYRVGVGPDVGAPHTATFCPNEGAITVGSKMLKSLALRFLDYEKEK